MPEANSRNPLIIGLVGSFGSGCTTIAGKILSKRGYKAYSLADALKKMYEEENGAISEDTPRRALQDFGDKTREKHGADYLAKLVLSEIKKDKKAKTAQAWVIDSIRNPAEIGLFRNNALPFFLFGVYAEKEERWTRVKDRYKNDRKTFEEDDRNDTGEDNPAFGQRVGDCFSEADVVIWNKVHYTQEGNDDFQNFAARVIQYAELVEKPLQRNRPIRKDEALMAMAYAVSQQSSCLQRKVGAVIVDDVGTVISSGFNEVPQYEKPCEKEYTKCYRTWLREELLQTLKAEFPDIGKRENVAREFFRKKVRMLDYCRALHAEENAIVSLAKNGRSVPLERCKLYTTTYPCRMCANKIVGVGVKRIVYMEPYPDDEAKAILSGAGVTGEFFEGVTFKAYFRIYGEEK